MATRTRSKKTPARGVIVKIIKIGFFAGLAALIALILAVYIQASSLPTYDELKSSPNGQMIRVRAADGSVLVSLGPSFGDWLDYEDIPRVMVDAMVSVEDRRFRSHLGVDPIGIARSAKVRLQRGRWVQGGSTITQQLARNIFLTNSRNFGRKFREWLLALAMERKFSKDQILELYLNKVYFGGGAYGIDAASRKFFGHPGNRLTLSEAAVIAGLVKAPSRYSPTADAEAALGRAGVVLQVMQDAGTITAAQAAAADPANVKLAEEPNRNSVRYFTDWALPQLDTIIDEATAPIEVWTTLDPAMQRAADKAIGANTPAGAQGALVAMDRDGAVRAMVGGRDYVSSIYNRATQAVRQPGSSFKLFVYLAALEAGYTPDDTLVDEPVTINGWSPRNNSRRNSGEVTLRTAFAYSINTIAAKIGMDVGLGTIADMARRFGITTPVNTHPSMVLGTSDVRLIDMTRAFASVSAKGVAVVPFGITKVTKLNGELLYEHKVDTSRVLVAPTVAAQMTDLLQTAVNTGTGRAAQIGRPVAGKTGTTSSNKDGWFLGFSSGLTTGIWMGRDDARALPGLQGGRAPAQAFADFMRTAVAKRPVENFDTEVTLPEWQEEPDDEAYFGEPTENQLVDENGLPVGTPPDPPVAAPQGGDIIAPSRLDQNWIDEVTGRSTRPQPQARPTPSTPPPAPAATPKAATPRVQDPRPTQ
ncbi:MAG: penicillin-binding protein [Sphingomonas sp. SCN 67-18]|uniref:transglycosylase domain-containing protein n=1 Tax=uncultured Sphingomonas sp. TaxID=158754 RepID=UPI000868A133|nr:PBP1A family penicillin-binding protein [Sphingomonas sp. SCN 67-18]ODU22296.1 MAG: penicillin-binding protein [Sphingomonas sp. SCN 67-18]